MKRSEYIPLALRTLSTVQSFQLNSAEWDIAHAIIGINTEIGELAAAIQGGDEINAGEEIGDILWYTAILESRTGFQVVVDSGDPGRLLYLDEDNTKTILRLAYPTNNLIITGGQMLDILKKSLFYKGHLDLGGMQMLMREFGKEVGRLIDWMGLDVEVIRHQNIEKLRVRYPDKFTQDDAMFRDLDAERDTLS
jgi:hypothetical protein